MSSIPLPIHAMQVVHSLKQGGSERLAFDLARSFDASGVRSSLCAIDFGGPHEAHLRSAGIPFHIMGRRPGFDWRLIGRLYRLFRSQRVNLVQTHHLTQLIYSVVGARLAGAALVHVEHEYFSLMRPKEQRRLRLLAPFCHRVVAVGEETARFIVSQIGLPPSQVTVIPNGVDVQRYAPGARIPRQALGLPLQGRLIGHVGRLEPEKDQAALLHAFRAVMDAHHDTRLVIIGDGSLRKSLEDLLQTLGCGDRVTLLGTRDDVADLLPHFDVFVLSSVNEGLPLAVLEAMACAVPVIATRVGDLPHVVLDGTTGLTVPPGDPQALAVSLGAVLDRPEWGTRLGAAGRRLVENSFNLAHTVEQYQALYDSVRARSRPPACDSRSSHPIMGTSRESQAVREHFDRDADRYLQERYIKPSAEQLSYLSRRRLALEMLGRGSGRALDVGSGPGVLTADLSARGFHVYSVDLSLVMLKRAHLAAADDGASVHYAQADLTRLPFKTGTFDAVTCLGVLAYVPNLDQALSEVARVLRAGGTAVLQTSSPWSPTRAIHRLVKPVYYRVRSALTGQPYRPLAFPLRAYGPVQLRSALEKAGFEVHDRAHYDFRPPLLETPAPGTARRIASSLQRLERSRALGWLGEGFVVKAVRL